MSGTDPFVGGPRGLTVSTTWSVRRNPRPRRPVCGSGSAMAGDRRRRILCAACGRLGLHRGLGLCEACHVRRRQRGRRRLTRRLFEYLVARDGPLCLCGRDLTEWPATLDHLHPLALAAFYAGPDIHGPANLQLLCRSCNRAKGARIQARPIRRRFRQPSLWQDLS